MNDLVHEIQKFLGDWVLLDDEHESVVYSVTQNGGNSYCISGYDIDSKEEFHISDVGFYDGALHFSSIMKSTNHKVDHIFSDPTSRDLLHAYTIEECWVNDDSLSALNSLEGSWRAKGGGSSVRVDIELLSSGVNVTAYDRFTNEEFLVTDAYLLNERLFFTSKITSTGETVKHEFYHCSGIEATHCYTIYELAKRKG